VSDIGLGDSANSDWFGIKEILPRDKKNSG